MSLEQAFEVATEFRFDVGQAILNTDTLKGAVDDLSKASGSALGSLNYLASGLIAHLGFGSGGLLSILGKAVQISEAFNESSLSFANNISSNMQTLTGTIDNFNDRLGTSQMLMGNISREAIKFGIDTTQLSHITQLLATPLANRGKLGSNYQGAISMGRNLSLASEAVGLNPMMSGEMLSRAITDHMAIHGALFARLVNTQAFKSQHIATQPQLMNMNTDRKIDLLSKALTQLAGDADWIAARMMNLGTQFIILKDQISVVLKPIGDAIVKPLVKMMSQINGYLTQHGEEIGKNIGKLIGNIFEDPKNLFVNLMQLKHLKTDFQRALDWSGVIVMATWIKMGLEKIGIVFNGGLIRRAFAGLFDGFVYALPIIWKTITTVAKFITPAIGEFIGAFAPLLFFFQIISRARAIAKVNDIENLLNLMPKLSAIFVKIKTAVENIMMPLSMAIDFWANLLAPLFQTSTWLNILVPVLDSFADILGILGTVTVYAMAGLSGLVNVIIGFVEDIMHMKNPFGNVMGNLKDGYNDFLERNAARLGKASDSAANYHVENNNHIEARFDMREQMEPDRIAFAVTTHLKKLALDAPQGAGASLASAFARPRIAGAN